MATLSPMIWSNGFWIVKATDSPDKGFPASIVPPGMAPGSGFWGNTGWALSSKGYANARYWYFCPLPLCQTVIVPGPNGQGVPTVSAGSVMSISGVAGTVNGKAVSNVALSDGPWLVLSATGSDSGTLVQAAPMSLPVVPSVDPSGWSGGTWVKGIGGLYAYMNGQASSSVGTWAAVLAGLGVAAAGAASL